MKKKELYRRYRPRELKDVIGQPNAVKTLQKFLDDNDLPHVILFTGPSGCGKTTMARILVSHLNCDKRDFRKINCASSRGIDTIRDIEAKMGLYPSQKNGSRVYLLDECHMFSKDAQNAALDMLEDSIPDHVYFLLCTTEATKLINTIRTRSTEIKCASLSSSLLEKLVLKISKKEKQKVSVDVAEKIASAANGSARKALVILGQAIKHDSEEEQLEAISKAETEKHAFDLAKLLINPRCRWSEVAKLLKDLEDDPEIVRRTILKYAHSVLLGGGKLSSRAYLLIQSFRDNFFDSGIAGLSAGCYELLESGRKRR